MPVWFRWAFFLLNSYIDIVKRVVGILSLVLFCAVSSSQNGDTLLEKYIEKVNGAIIGNNISQSAVRSGTSKAIVVKKQPVFYYEYKIVELDKKSPIKLDYNQDVQKYIDLYLDKRPDKVAEFLGLQELYFPIFEEYLDKYNLPLELKYLPIIESGLNPRAQSSSGAMGLWQLLLNSSKLLGLKVDSYIDERSDPYLSTDAACRYLKYLYDIFNDWQLVLAAYNGGAGEVRNAIIRSGGKTDFWQIQPYLPEQTKWYVPAYIAIVYLSNYSKEQGIEPISPQITYSQIDTLRLDEELEFSKVSEKTGVSLEILHFLNPMYKRDVIPDTEEPQTLVLPSDKILTFLRLENQIYNRTTDTIDYYDKLSQAADTSGMCKTFVKVGKGDFLHKIAMENGCTIDNLRAWNHLSNDALKIDQKLVVWLPESNTQNPVNKNEDAQYFIYTVKKGDTIWSIAERFQCDSINDIKAANRIKNEKEIKPGQKLKIRVR